MNNFISLIQKGLYDGTIFHRVIPGFMIQGGDPEGTGMGGPGYGIKGEFAMNGFENNLRHDRCALDGESQRPNSAGSQFFIMVDDAAPRRPVRRFRQGHRGASTSHRRSSRAPATGRTVPARIRVMEKVTVETFGVNYDEPVTGPERG